MLSFSNSTFALNYVHNDKAIVVTRIRLSTWVHAEVTKVINNLKQLVNYNIT